MTEIDFDDVKNKTPNLEAFLLEVARELGAVDAVMFDGSIKLLNREEDA